MIGNHTPRQCGIATFTTHLSAALGDDILGLDCFVLAMDDTGRRHACTCISLASGSARELLAWLVRNGRAC